MHCAWTRRITWLRKCYRGPDVAKPMGGRATWLAVPSASTPYLPAVRAQTPPQAARPRGPITGRETRVVFCFVLATRGYFSLSSCGSIPLPAHHSRYLGVCQGRSRDAQPAFLHLYKTFPIAGNRLGRGFAEQNANRFCWNWGANLNWFGFKSNFIVLFYKMFTR